MLNRQVIFGQSLDTYLFRGCCRCKAEGTKSYFPYFEPPTTQQMRYPLSRYKNDSQCGMQTHEEIYFFSQSRKFTLGKVPWMRVVKPYVSLDP